MRVRLPVLEFFNLPQAQQFTSSLASRRSACVIIKPLTKTLINWMWVNCGIWTMVRENNLTAFVSRCRSSNVFSSSTSLAESSRGHRWNHSSHTSGQNSDVFFVDCAVKYEVLWDSRYTACSSVVHPRLPFFLGDNLIFLRGM
jgi:hypothetical protein